MKASVTRFTSSERWFHNVVMLTVCALLLTGVGMICFNIKGDQGASRRMLVSVHQYISVVFIAAPLALVALGDKGVWRENLRLLTAWGRQDLEWLMKKPVSAIVGNIHLPPSDKFNPGQKLWVAFAVGASMALGVTGAIMWSVSSPILAIMIHVAVGMGFLVVLAGHVFMVIGNRETRPSLNSIISGEVDAEWAAHHHPLWMEREALRRVRERPGFMTVHNHVGYVMEN